VSQAAPISIDRDRTRTATPLPAILAVVVLCGQLYLVTGRNFENILATPFLPYSLIGSFAIHFWTRPGRAERLCTLSLALASALAFVLLSGRFRFDWPSSIATGAFLGVASLTVLAVQVVRTHGLEQEQKLHTLIAGSVFGYSALFIAAILNLTTRLHPRTYDLYLYAADAGYAVPLGAWIGKLVLLNAPLLRACSLVYESLPLAVSLLYAYERSGRRPVPIRVLPAFLGGGVAAYLLYNLLPATGPHYVFGALFPDRLPNPAAASPHLVAVGEAARNAVPSMHLACALLIFWACRNLPRWTKAAAGIYLVLTILATLGFGEHYVVDLVAAVPYALAVHAVCLPGPSPARRDAILLGILLTLGWVLSLRFATPIFHSVPFTWTATLATIAACWTAEHRLLISVRRHRRP
jgi:PAP2 superfamily